MEPRTSDKGSGRPINQSRREALMRFGRYAAMAPTVMVLLQSRESLAKGWGKGGKGHRWGRGGRRGKGYRNPY